MNKLLKKLLALTVAVTLVVTLAACADRSDAIRIGQGDWESNEFHDAVVSYIINHGYDVDTEIISVDTPVQIQSLRTGGLDLSTEIWTDNIETYQDDISEGLYHELSVNFDDNSQGLYIPAYLQEAHPHIQTVQDLLDEDVAALFDNTIYGGPSGWSITEFLQAKMVSYGLDEYYEFNAIESTATLNTTLIGAYDQEEPWIGYNWEPTWIMGQLDMVLLGDDEPFDRSRFDEGIGIPPAVPVTVVVTDGFEERFPEITAFLRNYETSSEITSEALAYMQENSASPLETAKWFLLENQTLWQDWVPEDVRARVMDALNE